MSVHHYLQSHQSIIDVLFRRYSNFILLSKRKCFPHKLCGYYVAMDCGELEVDTRKQCMQIKKRQGPGRKLIIIICRRRKRLLFSSSKTTFAAYNFCWIILSEFILTGVCVCCAVLVDFCVIAISSFVVVDSFSIDFC